MLAVKYLSKHFAGLVAVKDLNLTIVREGEILAIIGPNGAGKSTVFNLLTGTLKPTSGTVLIHEEDITGLKPYQHRQKRGCQDISDHQPVRSTAGDRQYADRLQMAHAPRASGTPFFIRPAGNPNMTRRSGARLKPWSFWGCPTSRSLLFRPSPRRSRSGWRSASPWSANPNCCLLDEPTGGLIQEETERIAQFIKSVQRTRHHGLHYRAQDADGHGLADRILY
jgi:branched-chain amino acid transport system ATP-binding protein